MARVTPATTATELQLVPPGTVVEGNGEGDAFEISSTGPRVFLVQMDVTETLEQESLDLAIWGSADGTNWGAMPLVKFPQRFYRGSTRMALDLTQNPEVRFIRARWQVNRWGRGRPAARFGFHVTARPA
jgi:hypothetical protein